jgi:hypothetical protein
VANFRLYEFWSIMEQAQGSNQGRDMR